MSDLPQTNRTPIPTADASVAAPPKKHRRRWFQFSLRTLLIVMMVSGPIGGWLAKKVDQARIERELLDVFREFQTRAGGVRPVSPSQEWLDAATKYSNNQELDEDSESATVDE